MYFVNDINLVTAMGREIATIVPELTNIIDPGIGSTVYLKNIRGATSSNLLAEMTDITWLSSRAKLTIKRLGQNPGRTGFSNPPSAGKQEGMGHPPGINGILQGAANMLLTG
jgi:hypothetical protein